MPKNELVSRYEQAAAILPSRLRKAALALSNEEKAAAEELRLRAGRPLTVLLPAGELPLEAEVEPEELEGFRESFDPDSMGFYGINSCEIPYDKARIISSAASETVVTSVLTAIPFLAKSCMIYVTCGAASPTFSNS